MKLSEATILLTFAAAFDRRTVGEADAEAWARALDGVKLDQAKDAVVEHYTNSREFLMPSDINSIVRRLKAGLRAAATYPTPPDDIDDAHYTLWLRSFWAAIEDGEGQEQAEAAAAHAVGHEPRRAPLELDPAKLNEAVEATEDALRRAPETKPGPRVIRRSPARWAADRGLQVVDPHNWDGDFRALYSEDEFDERLGGVMTKPFEQATDPIADVPTTTNPHATRQPRWPRTTHQPKEN